MVLSGTGELRKQRKLYPGSEVADVGTDHADVSGMLFRNMHVTRRRIRQRVTLTIIRVTADIERSFLVRNVHAWGQDRASKRRHFSCFRDFMFGFFSLMSWRGCVLFYQ
jgi:hypothetical protein